MQTDFIEIGNGQAVDRDRIPHLAFDDFRPGHEIVDGGGKVVQFLPTKRGSHQTFGGFAHRTACSRPAVMPRRPIPP
jgi:hypothetical protein